MRKLLCVLSALSAVGVSSYAMADLQGSAYLVTATAGTHTATYAIPVSALQPVGTNGNLWWSASWAPGSELPLMASDGTLVGKLAGATCLYNGDPQVSVNFSVLSGAVPTTFTISSALLTFPSGLYSAHGSAGVTLTDLSGGGATYTGLLGGGAGYEAYCNGTTIAGLVPSFGVGPAGTLTQSGAFGPTNYTATSMQAAFSFTLSPFAAASGTSVYIKDPVPAPAAATVLGMGGLLAARRRRR